jgi:hypothetical protein
MIPKGPQLFKIMLHGVPLDPFWRNGFAIAWMALECRHASRPLSGVLARLYLDLAARVIYVAAPGRMNFV